MAFRKTVFLLLCFGIFLGNRGLRGVAATAPDRVHTEYLQDLSRVKELGQKRNLEGLDRLASKLEEKWFAKNKEKYGYLMLAICGTLGSRDFTTERQYELTRKYAVLVLEKSRRLEEQYQIPIEVEFMLCGHVQDQLNLKEAVKGEDWASKRAELAKLYFHAWHRLERLSDENWDPNDPNIGTPFGPPAGYKGPGGSWMPPERITDPTLRAEYEGAIAEFRNQHKRHSEQRRLRQLKESHLPYLQKDLLRLYSGPLFNSKTLEEEALQKDMERGIKDHDVRLSILNGMRKTLRKNNLPLKANGRDARRKRSKTRPMAPAYK